MRGTLLKSLSIALFPLLSAFPARAQISLDIGGVNGGGVRIGTSSTTCAAGVAGGVRYNATGKCLELCDGTSWSCISVAACGDATPNTFNFTDLVNQATSTLATSNILQVTGISCVVNIAISGEGSPQFRTCSDNACSSVLLDWSASGTIDNNQYLQLRLTTSAIGGDTHSATVSVGTFADVWNATPTGDCTGSPVPGTICADGTVYAGQSPDGNVKMYTTRCDVGQHWDGVACAGTAMPLTWNDGFMNYVNTNARSASGGAANTATLVATDSNSVAPGIQLHNAAHYCSGGGFTDDAGYTDWYLPASSELVIMYGNRVSIGNFVATTYLSSTEIDMSGVVGRQFTDGTYTGLGKHSAFRMRCVRK